MVRRVRKEISMPKYEKSKLSKGTKSKKDVTPSDILAEIKKIQVAIADLKVQVAALGSQTLPPHPMVKPKFDPSGC
jgi:hypothetical protein